MDSIVIGDALMPFSSQSAFEDCNSIVGRYFSDGILVPDVFADAVCVSHHPHGVLGGFPSELSSADSGIRTAFQFCTVLRSFAPSDGSALLLDRFGGAFHFNPR